MRNKGWQRGNLLGCCSHPRPIMSGKAKLKARDAKARDPRVDDPRAERRAKADGAAWFERVGSCDFLVDNAFSFVKQQACVASQYRQLYENATSAPHARSARGALSGGTPSHRHVSTTAKWLLVTHVACFDHISVGEVFRTVTSYASPNFHVVLNLFRGAQKKESIDGALKKHSMGERPCFIVPEELTPYVTLDRQPGFKPIVWKYSVPPSLARKYDYIIMSDADIRFSPSLGFTLDAVDFWMRRTRASILQPTVVAERRGGRAGTGDIAPHDYTAECVAQISPRAVERAYVARSSAYEVLWNVLNRIPDQHLSTDTGLEAVWCGLLRHRDPETPACVIHRTIAVTHLDTHAIRRQHHDGLYQAIGGRRGSPNASNANNTIFYILKVPELSAALKNGTLSHKMAGCWSAD